MTLKLKGPGLLCLAFIATSALGASIAQAGEFTAEKYPATVTGTQSANHQFKFFGTTVNCPEAAFHGNLGGPQQSLTVGAKYSGCSTPNGSPVVVKMTSCDYVFHAGETLEADVVDGSLDIHCDNAGDGIFFEEAANGCVVKLLPQNTLTTLRYTNHKLAKDFDVDIELANMKYNQNGNCFGGAGMFFNGSYTGKSTITGDYEEEATGLTVD